MCVAVPIDCTYAWYRSKCMQSLRRVAYISSARLNSGVQGRTGSDFWCEWWNSTQTRWYSGRRSHVRERWSRERIAAGMIETVVRHRARLPLNCSGLWLVMFIFSSTFTSRVSPFYLNIAYFLTLGISCTVFASCWRDVTRSMVNSAVNLNITFEVFTEY